MPTLTLRVIVAALAAALLHSLGILRSPMRHYVGGLSPVQLRRVTSFVYEHLTKT